MSDTGKVPMGYGSWCAIKGIANVAASAKSSANYYNFYYDFSGVAGNGKIVGFENKETTTLSRVLAEGTYYGYKLVSGPNYNGVEVECLMYREGPYRGKDGTEEEHPDHVAGKWFN